MSQENSGIFIHKTQIKREKPNSFLEQFQYFFKNLRFFSKTLANISKVWQTQMRSLTKL